VHSRFGKNSFWKNKNVITESVVQTLYQRRHHVPIIGIPPDIGRIIGSSDELIIYFSKEEESCTQSKVRAVLRSSVQHGRFNYVLNNNMDGNGLG
jgi:hypothetical protein